MVDVGRLVRESLGAGDPVGWFDRLYRDAAGHEDEVPWARLAPDPLVEDWLDTAVSDLAGVDALVTGCGLGDDAAALARRGCRVTAIDVSPTAVQWAARRFAESDIEWRVADLYDLDEDLHRAFGLVVEVRTIQSLPPGRRVPASQAVAETVGPGGLLLVVAHMATSQAAADDAGGPPWPLIPAELADFRSAGLDQLALEHPAGQSSGVMEVRASFTRPA